MCVCVVHLCMCAGRHVCSCGSLPCFSSQGLSQAWNSPPKGGQPWSPMDHVPPPRHWNYRCISHTLGFLYLGFESPSLGPHSHLASVSQAEPSLQLPFPGFFPPRILFLPLTQRGPKVTLPALKSVFDSALVTFGGNGSEITPSSWES